MTADRPDEGVLVVRVERQDDYVLYTLVAETGAPEPGAEPEERRATTDRTEVVRVVTAFLDRF